MTILVEVRIEKVDRKKDVYFTISKNFQTEAQAVKFLNKASKYTLEVEHEN